jgi:hypothetical protein
MDIKDEIKRMFITRLLDPNAQTDSMQQMMRLQGAQQGLQQEQEMHPLVMQELQQRLQQQAQMGPLEVQQAQQEVARNDPQRMQMQDDIQMANSVSGLASSYGDSTAIRNEMLKRLGLTEQIQPFNLGGVGVDPQQQAIDVLAGRGINLGQ